MSIIQQAKKAKGRPGGALILVTVFSFLLANFYCFGHTEEADQQSASSEKPTAHQHPASEHSHPAEPSNEGHSNPGHQHDDESDVCCSDLISVLPCSVQSAQVYSQTASLQFYNSALCADTTVLTRPAVSYTSYHGPPGKMPPILLSRAFSARAPPQFV